MKAKMESERGSGTEWLEVRLSSGESLDPRRLEWLRSRAHRYLLETNAGESSSAAAPSTLRYNVTGLESLRSFLRSYEITSLQYENILVSVGEVVGMLRRQGQDPRCLQLDERYVFAEIDGNLWFLLLPVEIDEHRKGRNTLQGFLGHLAKSRHVAYTSAEDLARSERLRKLVGEQDFLPEDYESFLASEYGIRLDFSDTARDGRGLSAQARGRGHLPWDEEASEGAFATVAKGGSMPVAPLADPWAGGVRTTTFRLVQLDGSGCTHALGDCRTVLVGRGTGCDVRISGNPRISRIHARLERDGRGFRVTDLGSANGTVVQGKELGEGESGHVELGETFELADLPVAIRTA